MTDISPEKVVVGLSGGIDSYTCAYLLKMQKVDLIAVTITNDVYPFELSPHKLEEIKDFCKRIGIAHLTVDGSLEFKELVFNNWIDKTLSGAYLNLDFIIHDLVHDLLYQKMLEIGATQLATGHFAKIGHSNNFTTVQMTGDEAVDQSLLVSRLKPEILKSLVLPLSDLSKEEVEKIAENFGIIITNVEEKKWIFAQEFLVDVPPSILSKHQELANEPQVTSKVSVLNCTLAQGSEWTSPLKGFVKTIDGFKECTVFPRSLNSFVIELMEPQSFYAGEILSFVKKNNKNSKIYFSGECRPLKGEESDSEFPHTAHT